MSAGGACTVVGGDELSGRADLVVWKRNKDLPPGFESLQFSVVLFFSI